jgi:hypothetical protein
VTHIISAGYYNETCDSYNFLVRFQAHTNRAISRLEDINGKLDESSQLGVIVIPDRDVWTENRYGMLVSCERTAMASTSHTGVAFI